MFLKCFVSILFLFSFCHICFAQVSLIYPLNDSNLTQNNVSFKWESSDLAHDYVYRLDIAYDENWSSYSPIPVGSDTEKTRGLASHSIYYWRVNYALADTFDGKYPFVTEIYRFGVNKELPPVIVAPIEKEIPKEKEGIQRAEKKVVEKPKPLPNITKALPQKLQEKHAEGYLDWNTEHMSVLGISSKKVTCKFKYLQKTLTTESCEIPPLQVTQIVQYPFVDEFSVLVKGRFVKDISIVVDQYKCKRDVLKPISFFKCEESFVKSNEYSVNPNTYFRVFQEDSFIPVKSFFQETESFSLVAGYFKEKKDLKMHFKYFVNISDFDILLSGGGTYSLDPKVLNTSNTKNKPFSFPLAKLIGVTQWHGNTAFQKPHKGIDFGATKENVLAVSKGEVVGKGWDSYNKNSNCFSGGNYLLVKQENGMYTAYFHLEKTFVNTGDLVKNGQRIGISGNTGYWNCQKLGYHLHFETREGRDQSTHVNPVEYINVDWNRILTLNAKSIPGRLSGDNPHPGF